MGAGEPQDVKLCDLECGSSAAAFRWGSHKSIFDEAQSLREGIRAMIFGLFYTKVVRPTHDD
jgi:hypothetical protein